MGRRSHSGRRGSGGRSRSLYGYRSLSHAHSHSQSSALTTSSDDGEHVANQHKTTSSGSDSSSSDGGWFSSVSWFSSERVECKDLYQRYKECVNLLVEDRENDVNGKCSIFRDEFEESCGKYKSLLSSWWTEKDDKKLCKSWSEFYEVQCKRSQGPKACESVLISVFFGTCVLISVERACRGIKPDWR